MTKKRGSWKTKQEEKIVILKNLAMKGPMYSVEFEKMDEPIPHASVAKILYELKNKKLIKKISSKVKSKRGLVVPRFTITLLGLLIWFVNEVHDPKSVVKIDYFQYMRGILSVLSEKWQLLKEYYHEEFMMRLLAKVISNIEILASDPIILKYKTFYRGVTMEFKNTQEHKEFRNILKLVDSDKFKKGFESVVNFGFFLELYKLHETESFYYDKRIGLKEKTKKTDWLDIVKSDTQLMKQILIGFNTMQHYSKITYEGMFSDLDFIQGKGKICCIVCTELYDYKDEEKHYKLHPLLRNTLLKIVGSDFLLSRTLFEYELEFEKKKIFSFSNFFKV